MSSTFMSFIRKADKLLPRSFRLRTATSNTTSFWAERSKSSLKIDFAHEKRTIRILPEYRELTPTRKNESVCSSKSNCVRRLRTLNADQKKKLTSSLKVPSGLSMLSKERFSSETLNDPTTTQCSTKIRLLNNFRLKPNNILTKTFSSSSTMLKLRTVE